MKNPVMFISSTYRTLALYLLICTVVIVYSSSLTAEVLRWNDAGIIEVIAAADQRGSGVYEGSSMYPVPRTVYSFWYGFGDGRIFLFHLANILLHAANVLLLYGLLGRFGLSTAVALGAATFFGLHPMMTGTVAWLSQFPVICAQTFLLCFIHAMLSFHENGSRNFYAGMLSAAALFHLTVPGGITIPVVIFGMMVLGAKESHRRWNAAYVPFFIFPIAAFAFGEVSWRQIVIDSENMLRFGIVHGVVSLFSGFISIGITPIADSSLSRVSSEVSWYPIVLPFIIATGYRLGKEHRIAAVTLTGYGIFLLPLVTWSASGEWILNGHNFYASAPFLFTAIAAGCEQLVERFRLRRLVIVAAGVSGAVLIVLMTIFTGRGVTQWKTNETLWSSLTAAFPGNKFFLNSYGSYHLSKYNTPQAIDLFSAAIERHPADPEGYISRGYAYLILFQTDRSKSDLYSALRLDSSSALAYYNLGMAYSIEENPDSALICFSAAVDRKADFTQALNNRANVYGKRKEYVRALADYETAEGIDPWYADIYGNRGLILLATGNATGAKANFQRQSELTPWRIDVWIHFGLTGMMTGDTIIARTAFFQAQDLDSTNAKMYLSAVAGTFFRDSADQRNVRKIFGLTD